MIVESERHALALRLNRGFGLVEVASDKPGEVCFRTPAALAQSTRLYQASARRLALRIGARASGDEVD